MGVKFVVQENLLHFCRGSYPDATLGGTLETCRVPTRPNFPDFPDFCPEFNKSGLS